MDRNNVRRGIQAVLTAFIFVANLWPRPALAGGIAWSWGQVTFTSAATATLLPPHACGDIDFSVEDVVSVSTCRSPGEGPLQAAVASAAFAAEVPGFPGGLQNRVIVFADGTGIAGPEKSATVANDEQEQGADTSLEITAIELHPDRLEVTLGGAVSRGFSYQTAEVEFQCYIATTLEEAETPPAQPLARGLFRLAPGASEPIATGAFAAPGAVQVEGEEQRIATTVTCPLPAGAAPDQMVLYTRAHAESDDDPPTCDLKAEGSVLHATVQDSDSGLKSIQVTSSRNNDRPQGSMVEGFTPEQTSPFSFQTNKTDLTKPSFIDFRIEDTVGNVTRCDPVIFSLLIGERGRPMRQTATRVPRAERYLTLTNGTPGLRGLEVLVNGVLFRMRRLAPGEERTLDLASALLPGKQNRVTVTAFGPPGASAMAMIHAGPVTPLEKEW